MSVVLEDAARLWDCLGRLVLLELLSLLEVLVVVHSATLQLELNACSDQLKVPITFRTFKALSSPNTSLSERTTATSYLRRSHDTASDNSLA